MERDEDLEDGEMEDREREDGGVANIYDEQSSAGGASEISAAHPTPSFIPPPLNPYNRLLVEVLMERDEDLEDGEMEDGEREDGGVANIYDEQSIAGGAAEISAARHPTPSFIPFPPKNPYHRLLAEVLMERDEDLEVAEMEERETEDGEEGSNIYDGQGSAGGSAEISLDIPIRSIENRTQRDPPFFIHSNVTATASGPLDASMEHKVRRMPMRKKKFGRSAQRGGNRKYGCGGMPVAINRAPVAQVTAANKTPAKYLTKSELYTSLMESEVRINISIFYISPCSPLTISTNIAELTE